MTKVLISYSHDSAAHREYVLSLSERLRDDGIETVLDQYENGTPEQGWPRWMLDQLDVAQKVLVICTETYYRRFRGHEESGKGKGVNWEGALITQALYDARSASNKFIPVLFDSGDERYIPEPLRSQTCYTVIIEDSYQSLYDALLNQSGVEPGAIGVLKRKPRATGTPLRFDAQPAEITDYLHELIHNQYSRHDQRYVALEAKARRSSSLERAMDTVIDTAVILRDFNLEAETTHERLQEKHYDDALEAYRALKNKPVRRLAVLGEPGAGKSFSMQRIAVEYARQALQDAAAPVPMLVPLGFWTQEDMPLPAFIITQLGTLGRHFTTLRDQRRAVLMLDGLNEIPPGNVPPKSNKSKHWRATSVLSVSSSVAAKRISPRIAACRSTCCCCNR
ncbi:MAG: TIR domain-containing protein [Candidatus Competibacteraceae bacterium]|nr:TIR domain-containing protein [Candidatus Competibacteraceae bacterium]